MSHLNKHLNHPVKGARFTQQVEITPKLLRKLGWEGVVKRSTQLTGWTAFEDLACLGSFLKCEMCLQEAAAFCGYAWPETGGAVNLSNRVLRHNSECLLELVNMFISAGLMHKKVIKIALERVHRGQISKAKKHVAKGIITSAIKKYKGKKRAAKQLGISLKTLNFWLNV